MDGETRETRDCRRVTETRAGSPPADRASVNGGRIGCAPFAQIRERSSMMPNFAYYLPILKWGRHYDRSTLTNDLVADQTQLKLES